MVSASAGAAKADAKSTRRARRTNAACMEFSFAAMVARLARDADDGPLSINQDVDKRRSPPHAYDHDEGRDRDLLQGLGPGSADRVQPRLAAHGRRVGEPDVLPRVARLPRDRA